MRKKKKNVQGFYVQTESCADMGRRRNVQIKIWATTEEAARIKAKQNEAGIQNMGAFIRKMASDGYVIRVDLSDVKEVIKLMRANSNNINQYAKRANETGNIYYEDIKDIQKHQEELWNVLRDILDRLSAIK